MNGPPDMSNVLGNVYNKYSSRNPIANLLFQGFLADVRDLFCRVQASTVLEVGCGEGYLIQAMRTWRPDTTYWGVDLSESVFDPAIKESSRVFLSAQSAYQLGFPDRSFDLVVVAEVLEHLERPLDALKEIHRVARGPVILTVPREPIWRILNLARFAYWSSFGNTPGHIQHWTSGKFVEMVARIFEVSEVRKPLPWTVVGGVTRVMPRGILTPPLE